jgi:hypothetical protein
MRSDCLGGVGVGAPFRKTEDVGRAETKIITEGLSSEGPGSEGLFHSSTHPQTRSREHPASRLPCPPPLLVSNLAGKKKKK